MRGPAGFSTTGASRCCGGAETARSARCRVESWDAAAYASGRNRLADEHAEFGRHPPGVRAVDQRAARAPGASITSTAAAWPSSPRSPGRQVGRSSGGSTTRGRRSSERWRASDERATADTAHGPRHSRKPRRARRSATSSRRSISDYAARDVAAVAPGDPRRARVAAGVRWWAAAVLGIRPGRLARRARRGGVARVAAYPPLGRPARPVPRW